MITNPNENELPPRCSLDDVLDAVKRSGYPLQSIVAAELQKTLDNVVEEWGYTDRLTEEHRTLDVFAQKQLSEENCGAIRLRTSVALLVECKQSALPYIFFKSVVNRTPADFPTITGLRPLFIKAAAQQRQVTPNQVLGLLSEPSFTTGPPICASMARLAGKGRREPDAGIDPKPSKSLELSGTDAYNNTLLPLISAMEHLKDLQRSTGFTQGIVYPTIAVATCVLDAPMILAEMGPGQPSLTMAPWIRLLRFERTKGRQGYSNSVHVVDYIHRNALGDFLNEVVGFAWKVQQRAAEKAVILNQGFAVVEDSSSWDWRSLRAE